MTQIIPARDEMKSRLDEVGVMTRDDVAPLEGETALTATPKPIKERTAPLKPTTPFDSYTRAQADLNWATGQGEDQITLRASQILDEARMDTSSPLYHALHLETGPRHDEAVEIVRRAFRARFEMQHPGENRVHGVLGPESPEERVKRERWYAPTEASPTPDTADTVKSFNWSNGQELSPALYSDWLDLFKFASGAKNYQEADRAVRPFLEWARAHEDKPAERIYAGTPQAEDFLNGLFQHWDEDPRVYDMNLARFQHAFTHFADPVGAMKLVEEKGLNFQKEFVLGMIELDRRLEKKAAKGETRSLDPQERLERTRRVQGSRNAVRTVLGGGRF
jgi:hypothetical protein